MNVARILYPVETLGPGKRIGIWFSGCPRRCRGCSNPELWEEHPEFEISVKEVVRLVHVITDQNPVDGFTITGGDPFFQKDALRCLLEELSKIRSDILVYTGYYKNEIQPEYLQNIAVLIDGPYEEEKNNGVFLRGSSNQTIYVLNEKYKEQYDIYLSHGKNAVQNFVTDKGIISVGIHEPGFNNAFEDNLEKKGLTYG